MVERKFSVAEIILFAGTRDALGAVGLLLSGKLNRHQREAAGLPLAVIGDVAVVGVLLRTALHPC